ncbi:hypothetical protein [Salininema proteolyticum]|uniref:Uncharacterized protein n=1 Tax=Salininema proteolyticum TaxID=1607685 RepID=A0ABV8TW67_9ACTN
MSENDNTTNDDDVVYTVPFTGGAVQVRQADTEDGTMFVIAGEDVLQHDEDAMESFAHHLSQSTEDYHVVVVDFGNGSVETYGPPREVQPGVLAPGNPMSVSADDLLLGDFDDAAEVREAYFTELYEGWGDQAMRLEGAYSSSVEAVRQIKDNYTDTEGRNQASMNQVANEIDLDLP